MRGLGCSRSPCAEVINAIIQLHTNKVNIFGNLNRAEVRESLVTKTMRPAPTFSTSAPPASCWYKWTVYLRSAVRSALAKRLLPSHFDTYRCSLRLSVANRSQRPFRTDSGTPDTRRLAPSNAPGPGGYSQVDLCATKSASLSCATTLRTSCPHESPLAIPVNDLGGFITVTRLPLSVNKNTPQIRGVFYKFFSLLVACFSFFSALF